MFYLFERGGRKREGKREAQISTHLNQGMNHKPRHKPEIWARVLTGNRTYYLSVHRLTSGATQARAGFYFCK